MHTAQESQPWQGESSIWLVLLLVIKAPELYHNHVEDTIFTFHKPQVKTKVIIVSRVWLHTTGILTTV